MRSLLISLFLVLANQATSEPVLLMAEEDGCYWCARWNSEIAHIYPKTAEGQAAPLVRMDVHNQPSDYEFERSVHFTPTFILMDEGQEVARIEGYPGEDFFWGLLGMMLDQANISLENAS